MKKLKPCPFCGESLSLWWYVSPWSAQIKCGQCNIVLPNSLVRTAYHLDEDLPEWAIGLAKKAECAKDKNGDLITMWWIPPTDSFDNLGHTDRWNRRVNTEAP